MEKTLLYIYVESKKKEKKIFFLNIMNKNEYKKREKNI